jgi:Flp pilus assembly pilin Flp
MLMTAHLRDDERGATLIELMVGLAAGMVVLAALSMLMITTVRTTGRVSARVDATQRARVVMTNISEQLHSACIEPQMAPILAKSTETKLEFVHAASGTAAAVAPTPVKSTIWLEGETLKQADVKWVSGLAPKWVWSGSPPAIRTLLTKVGPLTPGGAIFTYWKYEKGIPKKILAPPTGLTEPEEVVQVQVSLNAFPTSQPVKDAGSDASLQTSAVLRLTPPTFSESAPALPCQ